MVAFSNPGRSSTPAGINHPKTFPRLIIGLFHVTVRFLLGEIIKAGAL
jgi:hypothetical protein